MGQECDFCGNAFANVQNKRRHMKTHHGWVPLVEDKKKKYRCKFEGCVASYNNQTDVYRHNRIKHRK